MGVRMCERVQFFKLKNGQATNFSILGPLEMELPMTHTHIIKKKRNTFVRERRSFVRERKRFWLCSLSAVVAIYLLQV